MKENTATMTTLAVILGVGFGVYVMFFSDKAKMEKEISQACKSITREINDEKNFNHDTFCKCIVKKAMKRIDLKTAAYIKQKGLHYGLSDFIDENEAYQCKQEAQ